MLSWLFELTSKLDVLETESKRARQVLIEAQENEQSTREQAAACEAETETTTEAAEEYSNDVGCPWCSMWGTCDDLEEHAINEHHEKMGLD